MLGRERDLESVRNLLSEFRLVTLTGAPGCGKSALGSEVARDAGDRFANATVIVDLVGRGDHDPLGDDLLEVIADGGKPRELLLVLDNCDERIETLALLVEEGLRRHPNLSVVATTREPLSIAGERIWPVGPLPPDAAAELFRRRVGELGGDDLGDDDDVAALCERLDRLPLGIRLAAECSLVTPVAKLASLDGSLYEHLAVQDEAVPVHHRSLRTAVEASLDRLSATEHKLLTRLSVFVGPFTIEGATALGGGEGDAAGDDVIEGLGGLVAKSLVEFDAGTQRERYAMGNVVRHFARRRLQAAGAGLETCRRHAEWCLFVAEQADRAPYGPCDPAAASRLRADYRDIEAALEWLSGHTDGARVARQLAGVMATSWVSADQFGDGRRWLDLGRSGVERAVTVNGAGAPGGLARMLWGSAWFALLDGEYALASSFVVGSLGVAEMDGDAATAARALLVSATMALALKPSNVERGRSTLRRSSELAARAGDAWCLTATLAVASTIGRYSEPLSAGELLRIAVESARAAAVSAPDDPGAMVLALGNEALRASDLETAALAFSAGTVLAERVGDVDRFAGFRLSLGQVLIRIGDVVQAQALLEEVRELCRRPECRRHTATVLQELGELAFHAGDVAEARRLIADALSAASQAGVPTAPALVALGRVTAAVDPSGAEAVFARALSEATGGGDDVVVGAAAAATEELGRLDESAGDLHGAAEHYLASLQRWAELRDRAGVSRTLNSLARAVEAAGSEEGADALRAAAPPDRGTLQAEEVCEVAATVVGSLDRPATGWDTLTPAERRVLDLVAENLTNREIGERLFVSHRTVQTHLAHAFAKLGVSSRREAAKEVLRIRSDLDA